MRKLPGRKPRHETGPKMAAGAVPASGLRAGEPAAGGGELNGPADARTAFRMILECCRDVMDQCGAGLADEAREYIGRIQQIASLQLWPAQRHTIEEVREPESIAPRYTRPPDGVRKPVDLGELSKTIVAGLMLTQPERRIKFITAISVMATGNEKLLRIALRNLLNNAWRNTSREEETVIELGIAEREGIPAYFIRDNGLDLDPFETEAMLGCVDGDEETDLTGLGVDTAARIIRSQGGNIWIEGRPGGGSVFYFTI